MITNFDPQKTIFIIDGSSFLYRAYYGMRPIHTSAGLPVQAVYNFVRMIKKLMEKFNPRYIVIAWDSKGATVRHEIYPAYKATRQEPPSDLFEQKRLIMVFADLVGIKQIEKTGVEADDIMYSVALDATKEGNSAVLITSDKDMAQIIDGQIMIYDWFKDEYLNAQSFAEKMGFPVAKIPFYYALIGDSSDNIPGVSGIGKVGATELVSKYDSLEDLYAHIDDITKAKTRTALIEQKDNAFLSYQLFKLRYYQFDVKLEDMVFNPDNWFAARSLFEDLEFKSLLKDLPKTGIIEQPVSLSESKGYQFITVTTQEQLDALCKEIMSKKECALDTEADRLGALDCELVGISLCTQPGTAYYIPFGHKTGETQLDRQVVLKTLKPILEDESIKKYLQHTKFDELVLSQYDVRIVNVVFDTMVAAHLVTEDWQRVGLKYLSQYYLGETMLNFNEVVSAKGYKNFSYVPLGLATEYAAADAHQTLRLVSIMQEELRKKDMEKIFYDIEFPLISVLFKMEKEGILLDVNTLKELNVLVTADLEQIEAKIGAALGPEAKKINLNSPKQLEQLLFFDLKLPVVKKTKTGYSTDQEVLEELAKIHPVPGLIIRYRELAKLKNTYLDALPEYVNKKDGRIHTTFSQTQVATGRLSSSEPNLQNIPVHTKPYPIQVRTAFKPQEGHVFLSADYSQIELRVLAYLSGDANLQAAFLEGRDIHTDTASKLFDVPLGQVTGEQRQLGKRINFSILYGLTPYGLSKDLGIPFNDAKRYIEKYFAQYPEVSRWMDQVIEETKTHGYVTTHWGRRRYIPSIYEHNKTLYDLAKRIAINTKAQGTAAELMKLGMIQLDKELFTHFPESRILLQIHDELLLSVPQHQIETVQALTKQVLESVVSWPIPLVVDTRIGGNWQEATK